MKTITAITNVQLGDEFTDDHILCQPLTFTDQDGETHALTLWCCGPDGYAAAKYAESSLVVMADLLKFVNEQLEADAADAEDDDGGEDEIIDAELTADQQDAIIADFAEWSGGFGPEDCDTAQRESYLLHAADKTLPKAALRRFILNFEQEARS